MKIIQYNKMKTVRYGLLYDPVGAAIEWESAKILRRRALLHNSRERTRIPLGEVETLSIQASSSSKRLPPEHHLPQLGVGEKRQVVGGSQRRVTAGVGRWWRSAGS
jgi:hypothetical protein